MKIIQTYLKGEKIYVIVEISEGETSNDLRRMIGIKEL